MNYKKAASSFSLATLSMLLIIAGVWLGAARATVQIDAYHDLPSDLPITGTWVDYELGLLRADTPCNPTGGSGGVIILGEKDGAHFFVVPEGVSRFHIQCGR